MAGMASVSGLASGIDSSSLVSQLMQIEARPQNQLRTRLSQASSKAAAYRDINAAFAALVTAAKALTTSDTWRATKATSSSVAVTATASAGAQGGSLTFSVDKLATSHAVVSGVNWTATTAAFGSPSLSVTQGTTTSTVTVGGSGTLADAVSAINASGLGLSATAVNTGSGYRLQVAANTTGATSTFGLGTGYTVATTGQDAQITVGAGGPTPYSVTSPSNTFSGVLSGTTFTASTTAPSVTVSVVPDADAVTAAVQAMVNAANAALGKIAKSTDTGTGSTAALKGDYDLQSLAGQVLATVSNAIGSNGSAAQAGIQLTRAAQLTFDAGAFKAKLASDPALVQRLLGGALGAGADNAPGTRDDTIAIDGVAARLQRLGQQANDSVSGTLTLLAQGQDGRAKDLQAQIDNWDIRLRLREKSLTDRFTAMETALGGLKNQSSWLTSQIAQLPGFAPPKS